MFGILNDLEQRRAAASKGQGDGVPVPAKVVFVLSAAQKNELALLRRPLIDHAMCAPNSLTPACAHLQLCLTALKRSGWEALGLAAWGGTELPECRRCYACGKQSRCTAREKAKQAGKV